MILVFDYDGTLHNTARLYGSAFRRVYDGLAAQGHVPGRYYSDEEMSVWLGVNGPEMWRRFQPDLPEDIRFRASAAVGREMIRGIAEGNAQLYPGVPETLDELRNSGWRMLILSNSREAYIQAHRREFGLDRWFEGYFCAESFGFIPKEDIFPKLRDTFPDDRYIIVGDREPDSRLGKVHGLPTIGCAFGFGSKEELDGFDCVISAFSELPEALDQLTLPRS